MHCRICDKESDSVSLIEPCSECQEAIQECIDGYPKVGEADHSSPYILDEEWDNYGL